jgi:NTP pyrophosphatase (non-canonical NTP hydrolase)
MTSLDEVLREHYEWANKKFADETLKGSAVHLMKEAREAYIEILTYANNDGQVLTEVSEELADVVMLASFIAHRMNINLADVIKDKLEHVRHLEFLKTQDGDYQSVKP